MSRWSVVCLCEKLEVPAKHVQINLQSSPPSQALSHTEIPIRIGVAPLNMRVGVAAPVMGFGFSNGGPQWGGPGMMAPGLGYAGTNNLVTY